MLRFKSSPFEADIEKATHENNLVEDWSLIMHICDNVINFEDGAKHCLKAIMKRLYHNVPRVVLQTLTLLDACVKNCDRRFILQVASSEFTNEVCKLLPKMHPSASTKLKELLQRWSMEEFKDDPELCIIPSLYYKLKSEGVDFPPLEKVQKKSPVLCTNPDGVSSQEEENDIIKAIEISLKDTGRCEFSESPSKPLAEPIKVRAIYDFDAAEDNELTIKSGEIVHVLDNSNANWWKGSNHRGEGLFPSNFVTEDLDFKPEEPKIAETVSKTEDISMVFDTTQVKIDEEKIEKLINWLNDIDPSEESSDPGEMLLLEKQCYHMTPLIEESLQSVDNRLAMLNLVNEKIMSAFEMFHALSDHSYYATGSLTQHVIQFPHPQASSVLHQTIQPPPNMPSCSSQINSLPASQLQTSVVTQVAPMPSNVISTGIPAVVTQSSAATSIPANVGPMSGYCVPPQPVSYALQYGPNIHPSGYIPNPASLGSVMAVPYAIPPYYNHYFANSIQAAQTTNAATAIPVESSSLKTTTLQTSVPVVPNYSNDLHNLNLNASKLEENPVEGQTKISGILKDQGISELEIKKNL